ncbi:hypothetical protein KSD_86010 [Ktedonobacter sp. SOSP1-85]|nr:hypothetical protein KSD_86010 [Ktedonobacter sp. SOSP1-85]
MAESSSPLTGQVQDTIRDCLRCHTACMESAVIAKQKQAAHGNVMLDCSELALVTAHMLLRDSPLAGYACQACSSACAHCADVASRIGDTDCANASRACENACTQLVKMVPF